DTLPLSSNGKVDRKRLPDPMGLGMSTGTAYVAPRNKTEETLAMIWAEILGREKIGINDNFFELGGHSLKIAQLILRINAIFLIRISFPNIYKNPTVAGIAAQILFILDQNKQKQKKEKLTQIEI
ncbi:Phosphopantetheine attachment site, partial [Chitinophaga sp. CF118]|uniref:phosphopantetheine-binding protein n=1 Tax=Chitinophaga sp. CF118 TaxID=1884367 RepID=UPI0008ECE83B